jgi:hypothetical protein
MFCLQRITGEETMNIETLKFFRGLAEAQAELATVALESTKMADQNLEAEDLQEKLLELSEKVSQANDLITARTVLFGRAMKKFEV